MSNQIPAENAEQLRESRRILQAVMLETKGDAFYELQELADAFDAKLRLFGLLPSARSPFPVY